MLKLFFTVIGILFFSQSIFAQWDEEEQSYVRQCAESQPLKAIKVYVNGRLKRIYHYDFYKRYTGYEQFGYGGKVAGKLTRQFDADGFLEKEIEIDEMGQEKTIVYSHNLAEKWLQREACWRFEIMDSITRKPTGKQEVRCRISKTVSNEYQVPLEEYIYHDSVFWLTQKFVYEGARLIRTDHYEYDNQQKKTELIYLSTIDYNNQNQKSQLSLQTGSVKKLKQRWEYSVQGYVTSIERFAVQYGRPFAKVGNEFVPTGPSTIMEDNKIISQIQFKHDKQGRVTELLHLINGKPGQTLTFKYDAPKS